VSGLDTIPGGVPEAEMASPSFPCIRSNSRPDARLVTIRDPGSFAAAQYEALRHLVERTSERTGLRIVAVTSPVPGDGKTLTAINLALALARARAARVLLMDADLRRPSVLDRLGLISDGEKGLTHAATSTLVSLQDVIRYSKEFNLFLLPAGHSSQAPYDVLSSPALARFLGLARQQFNFIVIDTPPTVGFPDHRLLETLADGSLLVIAAGVTPRRMVEMALETADPKKALGLVLNRADVGPMARYYDTYYRHHRPSGRQ
jgi:protein-tyrosine kinase